MYTVLGNEIDGDAFVLLTPESIQQMIQKQGPMLKFKYHFNQLSSSTSVDQLSSSTSVDQLSSSTSVDKESDGSDSAEEVNRIAINTRERKEPKVKSTGALSLDVIKEQSKIFGKGKSERIHLSSWQKAVNKAAFVLAQESPDCMYNRGQLKLDAEEEARKTYVFKKTHGSRSKFNQEEKPAKRAKLSSESRNKEIGICSLELHTLTKRAEETQMQLSRASATKDFAKCSQLHKEYRLLQNERQKTETKLAMLQRKQARHLKYAAKKAHNEAQSSKSAASEPQPLEDIRNFFGKNSPFGVSELADSVDHGPQSADTLSLSDNEMENLDEDIIVVDQDVRDVDAKKRGESLSKEERSQSNTSIEEEPARQQPFLNMDASSRVAMKKFGDDIIVVDHDITQLDYKEMESPPEERKALQNTFTEYEEEMERRIMDEDKETSPSPSDGAMELSYKNASEMSAEKGDKSCIEEESQAHCKEGKSGRNSMEENSCNSPTKKSVSLTKNEASKSGKDFL